MFIAVRLLLRLVWLAAMAWVLLTAGLFAIMWLPPERFASTFASVPGHNLLLMSGVLPFRSLWMVARDGSLEVGDPAPEFDLASHDKSQGRVKLSAHLGKPVVLVFGSYT